MAITGRFVLLAFAALAPLVLFPAWTTVLLVTGVLLLFLVIDLVVAAILMGLGMIMVPPATLSLPLKLLLFILIDGWVLVSRALLSSFWN